MKTFNFPNSPIILTIIHRRKLDIRVETTPRCHSAQRRSVDLRAPAGELVLHAAKSATNQWDGVIIDVEKGALTIKRRGFF